MRRASGFSFIEVIVALGLLAVVMISISAVFVVAPRQVKAGRTTSAALASARSILEELESWGLSQTYTQFGLDGDAVAYTVDTRTNGFAAKWQASLDEQLVDAQAEIQIASVATGGTTPLLSAANAVRLVVTISWTEGLRSRRIELGTVKL